MKLRNIIGILAVLVLLSAATYADSDTYVSGGSIRVSMINQDPDPVSPGEYLELRWMVINMGSTPLEDVEFMLVPDYPFELLGSDGKAELGTIQGHQKGEEGVILYYKVRIDEDASEGVNDLTLKYRYRGSSWTELEPFEIRVRSVDADIVIDSVKMDPERITPGATGRLELKIKNIADSLMKDVNVKLDLTLDSLPVSTTGADTVIRYEALPFAPTASSSEKSIQTIKPGASSVVSYDLMVFPDAESRVYKLPVIITYKDELENEFTKKDLIGVVVGSTPDIYAVIDSSDLIAGEKSGSVSFKFVNKGVTDIKFLDIILEETDEYKVISANKEYIGNIDSDDFESVEFQIYMMNNKNSKESSVISFPLKVTFKDANNKDYSKDFDLDYRVYTAEQKGEAKSRSAYIIMLVVIIMLVGWLFYRRWEKKRKKRADKK